MLCQNCKKNDATTHLKRIINGEGVEIHLCSECARNLGVADVLPGFSSFGDFFAGLLSSTETKRVSSKTLRCEVCGFTFDDIAKTGSPGCPNCYRVFAQRLRPVIRKLHGKAVYAGKKPVSAGDKNDNIEEVKIGILEKELERAVAEQNFEQAAALRDEIRELKDAEDF